MRTCIKCGRELPDGMFSDYWYAKTNVCKDCKVTYQRGLRNLRLKQAARVAKELSHARSDKGN